MSRSLVAVPRVVVLPWRTVLELVLVVEVVHIPSKRVLLLRLGTLIRLPLVLEALPLRELVMRVVTVGLVRQALCWRKVVSTLQATRLEVWEVPLLLVLVAPSSRVETVVRVVRQAQPVVRLEVVVALATQTMVV
mgnify:CR=1 FL=1